MNAMVKDEICRISDYQEVESELSLLIKQDMNEWIYISNVRNAMKA